MNRCHVLQKHPGESEWDATTSDDDGTLCFQDPEGTVFSSEDDAKAAINRTCRFRAEQGWECGEFQIVRAKEQT